MVFVLGGILTRALSGAIAVLVGLTGLFGGAAHYAAVFVGFALGIVILVIDALS
jgi:hypothetical protein